VAKKTSRTLLKARAQLEMVKRQRDDLSSRLSEAERKAELWDTLVNHVVDSLTGVIEEKVNDEVENAVSGLTIS